METSQPFRLFSGIGTMSRELVLNTCHIYDWVQLGGAINHPDNGKIIDMSDAAKVETGIKDIYLKIYEHELNSLYESFRL